MKLAGNFHHKKFPEPLCQTIRVLLNTSLIVCFTFFFLLIPRSFDDISAIAEAFGLGMTAFLSLVKMLTFYKSKQKFYDLMEQVENFEGKGKQLFEKLSFCNQKASVAVETFENYSKLVKTKKLATFLSTIHLYCCLVAGVLYSFKPFIENFVYFFLSNRNEFKYAYNLPLEFPYLFDARKSPAYEISFAVNCLGFYICPVISVSFKSFLKIFISFPFFFQVAVDSIFFSSCLYIATYCDILRHHFDGDKKKFVQYHLSILSMTTSLNNLYKPIVCTQLLTTNILLCMIGFQVVMAQNYNKLFSVGSFGLAALNQLFLYCFGGQVVFDKTASIAMDFYDSDRDLVIIVTNAMNGFKIRSAVYTANLPTFRAILSSAQGLITALKSIS